MLEHLDHHCFKNMKLRAIITPAFKQCKECNITISNAINTSVSSSCPSCNQPLTITPETVQGEVHAELCTSKYSHYSTWYREGKITKEEYNSWVNTLTPEEKTGHYAPAATHKIICALQPEDLAMKDQDFDNFKQVVNEKLRKVASDRVRTIMEHKITVQDTKLDNVY